jgi:tRNA1Val (adenine37-N6)-methyltransferase
MANSFFEFKQFTIHQDNCAFKVTTDACILGAYPELFQPEKICDIGAGTGILTLMLAQKYPGAMIDAIEIEPLAAGQADENINSSPWENRISIFNESIQRFTKQRKYKYDMIICNPPYFEDHLMSKDQRKNLARHNYKLSLSELVECVQDLVIDKGFFYTILPPQSYEKLKSELENKGFNLYDKLEIISAPEKSLYRIVAGFCKMALKNKTKKLVIHHNNGEYTDAFKDLLKDYYLAF